MAEKNVKARIIHKHDTEVNWNKATGFIPNKGEIIVYDVDETYSYERFKIGDGVQNVIDLPFFAAGALTSEGLEQVKGVKVDNAINADNATEATHAASADNATNANKATVASGLDATGINQVKDIKVNAASSADSTAEASHATNADKATNATSADSAKKTIGTFTVNGVAFDGSTNKSVTITVPDELADLTADSTHRLVTDEQITEWDNKPSLEQIAELELITIADIDEICSSSIVAASEVTF